MVEQSVVCLVVKWGVARVARSVAQTADQKAFRLVGLWDDWLVARWVQPMAVPWGGCSVHYWVGCSDGPMVACSAAH